MVGCSDIDDLMRAIQILETINLFKLNLRAIPDAHTVLMEETCRNIILLLETVDEHSFQIYLLAFLYKLLTKYISNRLTMKLDSYQPPKQAGFYKGYSSLN